MTENAKRLELLLRSGLEYFVQVPASALNYKISPEKWSKKEILGHLIDSGINNLQRFTEIRFESQPYKIRGYNQDELVKSNDYQYADGKELVQLWFSLNQRILRIMQQQTETTLGYEILLPNGEASTLGFLMTDYVDHLEYHLKQITKDN